MLRFGSFSLVLFCLAVPLSARQPAAGCGTTRENANEELFLHRQAQRAQRARTARLRLLQAPLQASTPTANRDQGNLAIIEDSDGVVERLNQFNLDFTTLTFTPAAPSAARYRYSVEAQGYDAGAAAQSSPVAALDDDDSRQFNLPFAFPFFGVIYNQVFLNSDGNLTFTTAESASTGRSLGRMTAGPPRIAPLFDDLDPSRTSGGVRMFADTTRVVFSWVSVPEYSQSGFGARKTFQVRLYPDGRIQFAYSAVNDTDAVVGIAPGGLTGAATLVSFRNDPSGLYSGAIAERFGSTLAIDVVTVAQKFYQTHDDAYDYLVIYNNMGINALPGALAYESTVRSSGTGYGFAPTDTGQQYGSPARLHSIMNMGRLIDYPKDPNALVPLRTASGDTPLTVLGHEAGHLFMAFASIKDPNDPAAQPMLGYGGVHWSFVFNSEASLDEGERIADRGPGVSPRFLTTGVTLGYSPLDQYLMGFRAPGDVPDTFVITGYPSNVLPTFHPVKDFGIEGDRLNIAIDDIIRAQGRRTPDHTVAQRRYRFAFILVVAQGSLPAAEDVAQVETYRQQFEAFYAKAAENRATAETTLKRRLKLSLSPAAGVLTGATATATLTLQTPPAADLTVQLRAPDGYVQVPASLKIAAGALTASFTLTGVRPGVEEILIAPLDPAYETAVARVQVADASLPKLILVSGDNQVAAAAAPLPNPIVVRLTDVNGLPYPSARILAAASNGGSVTPAVALTDEQGVASFRWTPGAASANQLKLSLEATAIGLTFNAGGATPSVTAVMNAASFVSGIAPGSLETLWGVNLAGGQTPQQAFPWPTTLGGVRVLLNGSPLPLLYVSDAQVNFYVPGDTQLGPGSLTVITPSGAQAGTQVNVVAAQPGIFPDAVLHAGTARSAVSEPVAAGDYIEIYCTGLGATRLAAGLQVTAATPTVYIGPTALTPSYSGLAPGFAGLYQINVQVPPGIPSGLQPLVLTINQTHSNEAKVLFK